MPQIPVCSNAFLTATKPLENLTATKPLENLTATKPLENLTATKPLENLTATKPLENLTATKPLENLTATKPLENLTATKPLENLTATKPLENLTATKPLENMDNPSSMLSRLVHETVFTALEDPVYQEMKIFSFVFENDKKDLLNPLIFLWTFNPQTDLYEIKGEGPYQDILVYGDSWDRAAVILEQEVLPCLWEDYANEDDARLSRRARLLKADFLSRIAP